jgi:Archaeal fructose-1,6-bisphosphatase and related enzymes of inositol monophosphatase family
MLINSEEICRVFREISARVAKTLRDYYGREEYNEIIGLGVSGDVSRRIDIISEDMIEEELEKRGFKAWLVGEEKGVRRTVNKPDIIVLVDPLDGSLNYASNIPFASVSIAVYPYGVNNIANPVYGVVYNVFTDDVIELCQNEVYFNNSRIKRYLGKGLEVLSIYTENPEHLKLVRKAFTGSKFNLKTRTMGSASIEASYAAIGFIGGFMHLTGRLRNSDIAVALAIAAKLGTSIFVKPDLLSLRVDDIQKIDKVVIAPPSNPVWKIINEL